jgi:hypothetical protein
LFRKNKVASMYGRGRFVGVGENYKHRGPATATRLEVIEAKHVIIATGSAARQLPGRPVDNDRIVDNVGALAFREVPKRLGWSAQASSVSRWAASGSASAPTSTFSKPCRRSCRRR